VKRKKTGFTMVEILTVVGIIAILVAVLVPTLSMVRIIAKETQQKAQLTAIDLALTAFKSDYGDYPQSNWVWGSDYCGAQKLAEALLGLDLLGFHPDSDWNADGCDDSGKDLYPDNLDPTNPTDLANLNARRGPYLDAATANVFRLGKTDEHDGLFDDTKELDEDTYVICDVFATKSVTLADGTVVRAGAPILYYRANTSSKMFDTGPRDKRIYCCYDNAILVALGRMTDGKAHKLADDSFDYFYDEDYKIIDPKVTAMKWPYRADSYILISAGADGLYGTEDDICNF